MCGEERPAAQVSGELRVNHASWRWSRSLAKGELSDPQALSARFDELVGKGVVKAGDAPMTAFYALAAYCLREGKTNPCGLLTRLLRAPDLFQRTWQVKPSHADEEWARAAIRKLQQRDELPRDSDLSVDADDAEADVMLDRLRPHELNALVVRVCGPSWDGAVGDKPPAGLRPQLRDYLRRERQNRKLQRAS